MQTLGEFLRYVRRERGFTQDEVGEKLSVVTPVVSKWENDKSVPDLVNICKLCNIYSVSIEELNDRKITDGGRVIPPESFDGEKLGRFLKKLRTKNSLSQSEVGEKLFVTSQTVSKWESGSITTLEVLNQFSELYSVSPDMLLSDTMGESSTVGVNVKAVNKFKKTVFALSASLCLVILLLGGFLIKTVVDLNKTSQDLQITQSALSQSEEQRAELSETIRELNQIIEEQNNS
ncbi:MAG: helix-turn-helix transcriptional regulator [Clostridia bacterium]|nr:helix-turn-helix transcriptional regulator [Clostridia bacterium]